MFVLVLGRSRSWLTPVSDLERGRAQDFRWLWRWRYTCSHSEHSSQAHQRRWYLGVPPWESRSPPGFLERPPPKGGGLSHSYSLSRARRDDQRNAGSMNAHRRSVRRALRWP